MRQLGNGIFHEYAPWTKLELEVYSWTDRHLTVVEWNRISSMPHCSLFYGCSNDTMTWWISASNRVSIQQRLDYVHSKPDSLLCRQQIYPVKYEHHLSERWSFTLKIGAVQLRSATEIAPKLPFSCVNRSPIQYNFRSGTKAIPHSVNIALQDWFIWFLRLILSNASRTEIAWSP